MTNTTLTLSEDAAREELDKAIAKGKKDKRTRGVSAKLKKARPLNLKEAIAIARGEKAPPDGVLIKPLNQGTLAIRIRGTVPLVIHAFGQKALTKMRETHEAGSQAKSKKTREPKNVLQVCEDAKHKSAEGWEGFPAGALRAGMISACRLVGFKMTLAKLSIFVKGDGVDAVDKTPLIRIHGEATMVEHAVRNANGVADLRHRPCYEDWYADLVITWDKDQFSMDDVVNLVARVGLQIGIGEGRPDSKKSAGMGWGLFEIENMPADAFAAAEKSNG